MGKLFITLKKSKIVIFRETLFCLTKSVYILAGTPNKFVINYQDKFLHFSI